MARGNDLNGETPFYCEVEECEQVAVRVEGSPVYHYTCREHAERMGLWVSEDHERLPPPVRTIPLAVFDGFSPAQGRTVRVVPIEQAVIALEDALAADEPVVKVRQLLEGMRTAAFAEPEEIPSHVAPGY